MVPVGQSFSSAVGPGAIDPGGPGAGWAGVECAPRNVGASPGDSRTSQPADTGEAPTAAQFMAPHKLATIKHRRVAEIRQVELQHLVAQVKTNFIIYDFRTYVNILDVK